MPVPPLLWPGFGQRRHCPGGEHDAFFLPLFSVFRSALDGVLRVDGPLLPDTVSTCESEASRRAISTAPNAQENMITKAYIAPSFRRTQSTFERTSGARRRRRRRARRTSTSPLKSLRKAPDFCTQENAEKGRRERPQSAFSKAPVRRSKAPVQRSLRASGRVPGAFPVRTSENDHLRKGI